MKVRSVSGSLQLDVLNSFAKALDDSVTQATKTKVESVQEKKSINCQSKLLERVGTFRMV